MAALRLKYNFYSEVADSFSLNNCCPDLCLPAGFKSAVRSLNGKNNENEVN